MCEPEKREDGRDAELLLRAKALLSEKLGMTEAEAHRLIERQAMDLRVTKREICRRILLIYEY